MHFKRKISLFSGKKAQLTGGDTPPHTPPILSTPPPGADSVYDAFPASLMCHFAATFLHVWRFMIPWTLLHYDLNINYYLIILCRGTSWHRYTHILRGHTKIRRHHDTHGTDFIGCRRGEGGASTGQYWLHARPGPCANNQASVPCRLYYVDYIIR